MALPVLRLVASSWIRESGELPQSELTDFEAAQQAASAVASGRQQHPATDSFRRDVELAAAQQHMLQQRGPVGSRIVELAAMDGPVQIKRIPNNPRPVTLVNALSGPAPTRRPTAEEEASGSGGSSGGGIEGGTLEAVEDRDGEQHHGVSPRQPLPFASPARGVQTEEPPAEEAPPAQEEAAAGQEEEEEERGVAAPEEQQPGASPSARLAAPGDQLEGSSNEPLEGAAAPAPNEQQEPFDLSTLPQVQQLLELIQQARDRQSAVEQASERQAAQIIVLRDELHRAKAAGEKSKGRSATSMAQAEEKVRTANEAAAAALERRNMAEAQLKRHLVGSSASSAEIRDLRSSLEAARAEVERLKAAAASSAAAAAASATSDFAPGESQRPFVSSSQASPSGSRARQQQQAQPSSGADLEALLASHRRVVAEYENRVSRLSSSFAAARDNEALAKSQVLALRAEVERLGGEVLSIGNVALAAGAKARAAEAALAVALEEADSLRVRMRALEDAMEASLRREDALAVRGVGVASLPMSPRGKLQQHGAATASVAFMQSPRPSTATSSAAFSAGAALAPSTEGGHFSPHPPPPAPHTSFSSSSSSSAAGLSSLTSLPRALVASSTMASRAHLSAASSFLPPCLGAPVGMRRPSAAQMSWGDSVLHAREEKSATQLASAAYARRRVTLKRSSYRVGELPDVVVTRRSILAPLHFLVTLDDALAAAVVVGLGEQLHWGKGMQTQPSQHGGGGGALALALAVAVAVAPPPPPPRPSPTRCPGWARRIGSSLQPLSMPP